MKKPTIFLFAMALAFIFTQIQAASAEHFTLPEIRQQAQLGWHQTYEAHGRSIIVEVAIEVPEAAFFPAFRAGWQEPSPLLPVGDLKADHGDFDGENTTRNLPGWFQISAGDSRKQAAQVKKGQEPHFEGHSLYPPEIDWDRPYAINNQATVRSLYEKALGLWNRYFEGPEPGLRLTELWAGTACRAFDWELQEFVGPPLETSANAYLIPRFEQLAGGIPLLTYAEASFLQFGGLYPGFQPLPMGGMSPGLWIHSRSLQAMTGQEGLQETIDFFTLRIGDKLAEDVPLCNLKTVLSTYEALILSGRLRHVHRLRLGYAIWEDSEHPRQLLLQPAWVAWGVLLENPEKGSLVRQEIRKPGGEPLL